MLFRLFTRTFCRTPPTRRLAASGPIVTDMLAAAAPVTCLLLSAALGETRIGILPVNSAGDPGVAHTLTAALVAEMRRSAPSAEVFGPDDVTALMGAARAGACADVSCFGAMADGAGVDRLVLADLVNLGPDNLLTLTLLDVRRKVVLGSAEDRGQALVPAVTRPGDHQSGDAPESLDRLASAVGPRLASASRVPASETAPSSIWADGLAGSRCCSTRGRWRLGA